MEAYREELRQAVAAAMPGKEQALVFGEGPMRPKLMLIGEAPGEQETLQGRPFVGKAGKNLDRFLELARLCRGEIYISNTVKVRPTKIGKTGRIGNRPPSREEIDLFRPWLLREIELIRPMAIATLGNVPLKTLAGAKATIGDVHGSWVPFGTGDRALFSLYHPASMIYNRSLEAVYEADVRQLAEEIAALGDKA